MIYNRFCFFKTDITYDLFSNNAGQESRVYYSGKDGDRPTGNNG